jgi:hypothetical protein
MLGLLIAQGIKSRFQLDKVFLDNTLVTYRSFEQNEHQFCFQFVKLPDIAGLTERNRR